MKQVLSGPALILGVVVALSTSLAFATPARFTTSWIDTYDVIPGFVVYWQTSLYPKMHEAAEGFSDSLDVIDVFWWNRSGSQVEEDMFENPDHDYWIGSYDIHYHAGHGNPSGPAMWAYGERGNFNEMEVGPELEWLALCSCQVVGQSDPWNDEFKESFQNGLHGVMGGYGTLAISGDEGDKFADNLRDGDYIKDAWLDSHDDGSGKPGIIYAGTSLSNCWTRIDNEQYWNQGTVYSDPNPGSAWCRYHRE